MKLSEFVLPAVIAISAALILCLARGVILQLAKKWTERTNKEPGDPVIRALRTPSLHWCLALGRYTSVIFSQLSDRHVNLLSTAVYIILIASITLMTTWQTGRKVLHRQLSEKEEPMDALSHEISNAGVIRVPGTAVFMVKRMKGAPPMLVHHIKHNQVFHEKVLLLTVITEPVPRIPAPNA